LSPRARHPVRGRELDDPAGKDLDTVRRIRHEIRGRVQTLLDELDAD
jgi:hypothetical protein